MGMKKDKETCIIRVQGGRGFNTWGRSFCARPSAANSEILSSFMLSIDVVAQVITWRFELLSATSIVALLPWSGRTARFG